ncbi:MAG: DUF2934 domain-containing protein [Candidatus Acidiferrales bacterium]
MFSICVLRAYCIPKLPVQLLWRAGRKPECEQQGVAKMKNSQENAILGEHGVHVEIANAADYRKAISAAVKKRAYEIYQRHGSRPGQDQENWHQAECEILVPLTCGILRSEDGYVVELHLGALAALNLEKIVVCVEPHRLLVVGKKRLAAPSGEDPYVYRFHALKNECDPNSPKLRQHGALLEIELRKAGASKKSAAAGKK